MKLQVPISVNDVNLHWNDQWMFIAISLSYATSSGGVKGS